jgi:hypothetical protein
LRHFFILPVSACISIFQHSTACLFVGAICSLMGCGGDAAQSRLDEAIPNRETVVPVSGVVLIDGMPLLDLTIRLVRADAAAPAASDPKAVTDADGKFKFTTYLDGDGVPPGKYRLLVEQLERQGSGGWGGTDKLKNRYNHLTDPATTIEIAVGSPVQDLKLDLQVSKKPEKSPPPYPRPVTGKPIRGRR